MEPLKIEYVPIDSIKPYEKNAKLHPQEQVEQIKRSIRDNGMNDPIGVWHDTVVEGHGRLLACKELGMTEVPVIRLDHMTDEQRREYMLIHNQTTMNSGWDFEILNAELGDLVGFDAGFYGFDLLSEKEKDDDKYSKETKIPQYEPKENAPEVSELINHGKVDALIQEINLANISEDEKEFLRIASYRHAIIDFDSVADYYASASPKMQRLMEENALVLIDIDDAIANGFTTLSDGLDEIMEDDDE